MGILEEVNSRYDTLSPVQKRIADFIFKYPMSLLLYVKGAGGDLGVTEVTVLRFAKKIGAANFVELKQLLREHLQTRINGGDFLNVVADHVGRYDEVTKDKDEMFRNFVENEQNVIRNTFEKTSLDEILEAVSLIKQASNVYVVGSEIMTGICSYLCRRLLTIGIRAIDLSNMSRALHNNYVSNIGPEDVVILFCTPGYARYIVNTARFLEKRHVPMIAVTDRQSSPIASLGTVTLLCDNHDMFFYNSITGYFSMSNAMVYFAAMDDPQETSRLRGRLSEAREAIGSLSVMREKQ